MSYVLEALKKAEAERHRGEVPGLHAAPSPLPPVASAPRAVVHPAIGFAAVAVAVAAGVTLLRSHDTPAPAAPAPAPVSATGPVAPMPAATPAPAAVPAPAQPAPRVAAAAPAAPVAAVPTPAPTVPAPPAPRPAVPAAAPVTQSLPPVTAPAPAIAPTAAPPMATTAPLPSAPAPAPAPDNRILSIGELPPETRRELPTLVVSGSVYSEVPSARFVMLNGQLMHEGDRLGNDLVLEQIQLRFAVLRYKGTRFRITY